MKLNEIDKEILTILNEARETKSGLYEGKADLFLVLNEKSKFRKGQFDYSIRKLKDNDFIKPLKARGVYKITDKGVRNLNGDSKKEVKEFEEEKPSKKEKERAIDNYLNKYLEQWKIPESQRYERRLTKKEIKTDIVKEKGYYMKERTLLVNLKWSAMKDEEVKEIANKRIEELNEEMKQLDKEYETLNKSKKEWEEEYKNKKLEVKPSKKKVEEEIFRDVEGTLKRRVKTIDPVIKRKTKEEKIAEAEEQLEKLKDRYVDATIEKKHWHDLQKISDQIEAKEGEVIRLKYGLGKKKSALLRR